VTRRPIARIVQVIFNRFLLLPIGAAIAIVWANSASESYFLFARRAAFAVNDIGMAFFFALVAQEVVEAVMSGGALHSWRRWTLPIVAAIGGIAGAAGVYLGYVHLQYEDALSPAWPIACAIDAAATYYVMKTILPRGGALPFALLVAIVTDAIGLVIIAPRHLVIEAHVGGAALITIALGLAVTLRALNVRAFWPYVFVCGAISWVAFYREGLHPAFALIPIVPFLRHEPRHVNLFDDARDDDAVHHTEHQWHLLVQAILFAFGLVNAGVILKAYDTATWGMLLAALVGRPAGILVAVWLGTIAGLHKPRHVGWGEMVVVACAAASGFAIALFFATGLLATGPVLAEAKFGVLLSAAGAGMAFGAARLLRVGRFVR
jgi:NhaA family Na+:H+ antiporter